MYRVTTKLHCITTTTLPLQLLHYHYNYYTTTTTATLPLQLLHYHYNYYTTTTTTTLPLQVYNCIQPQSIRAMQWLTATMGLFHSCATVRATTATDTRGAAIPGPTTRSNTKYPTLTLEVQPFLDLPHTATQNTPH